MWRLLVLAGMVTLAVTAHTQTIQLPKTPVTAGAACTMPTSGVGKAVLLITGPSQMLRRDVQLGSPVVFSAGELYGAGHYLAVLIGEGTPQAGEFDVTPAMVPGSLGFLAKPSRLPIKMPGGISGAVYVFDRYHNLITLPMTAKLELTSAAGSVSRSVTTHNGLAWTRMDSGARQGSARFTARVGDISSTHVINQVPGDPCSISISAKPLGARLQVQTAPVRDCSGNLIPDGTIITFTEVSNGTQSTVDVPLMQGTASAVMPADKNAKISVASGAIAGNEIHWDGTR